VKLLLDTSVWIEHLRHAVLGELVAPMRGRFQLRLDVVVASELRAGCRTKRERRVVNALCAPHERADRLLCPERGDFERAASALSRLRERGRPISGRQAALLDALIVSIAAREGALLVTSNLSDFQALAPELSAHVEGFERFRRRLLSDAPRP
jgi:predicted nucleic acid-binding protein